MLREWDVTRLDELTELWGRARPEEALTADELRVCWEDGPGVVMARADGSGAVAAVARGGEGHVRLVVVDAAHQRSGVGRALLDRAAAWLADAGCSSVAAGGEAPLYLWPGVDRQWTPAVQLFESAGYVVGEFDRVNMAYPSRFRAPPPEGTTVRRAEVDDGVVAFVASHWPGWAAETERALTRGTCFVAVDESGRVAGFVCHSVVRTGWLGPMGTDARRQRSGVGKSLLSAVAVDVEAFGRDAVEVEWVGPREFYAHAAGAWESRVFKRLTRPL